MKQGLLPGDEENKTPKKLLLTNAGLRKKKKKTPTLTINTSFYITIAEVGSRGLYLPFCVQFVSVRSTCFSLLSSHLYRRHHRQPDLVDLRRHQEPTHHPQELPTLVQQPH